MFNPEPAKYFAALSAAAAFEGSLCRQSGAAEFQVRTTYLYREPLKQDGNGHKFYFSKGHLATTAIF